MSRTLKVTWSVDIEIEGSHAEAAQEAANRFFQERIAAGEPDTACVFTVTGEDGVEVVVDLAELHETDDIE